MMRKTIVFFTTLIVAMSCVDAFAVPSVRQLGTNVPVAGEKPVTVLPNLPKQPGAEIVRAVKTQASADKEVDDPARMSVINTKNSIKTISSSRIKQQPASSGNVSDAAFEGIITRVEALETKDAIAGVRETGSGNYVTSVSVDNDNNMLNVEKTRVLYAPVRNEGGDAIVSDAEIWLVR